MARSRTTSNAHASADTNATSQATPDSSYEASVGANPHPREAEISRSAGLRAIERLRKRLDTIDDHRHTLLRWEQLLVEERDELVESLNSIEVVLMAGPPSYTSDASHSSTIHSAADELIEDVEESEPPSKRQVVSAKISLIVPRFASALLAQKSEASMVNQSVSKPKPLTALGTEPTLITECPPHLLQPSKSLPRPPSSSPLCSFAKTQATSPRPGSITRNGIRFPPGSAPRLSRGRSSSPLTQMLPPPVPSSPATPIATKGYNPIIRDLSSTEFESPTHVGSLVADDMPMSTPQPKLTPESGCADPERRLSRPLNGTIPIYLMLNNSSSGWSLTHMDPERTPSPPIGAPHSSWAVRPDVRAKREEFRGLREPETQNAKGKTEKYEQNGPASRTRARVNGGAAANNKGKGRV